MKHKGIIAVMFVAMIGMSLTGCNLSWPSGGGNNGSGGNTGGGNKPIERPDITDPEIVEKSMITIPTLPAPATAAAGRVALNAANGVKLTFDSGDGAYRDGRDEITLIAGDGKVTVTELPVLDGCAFSGWYVGDELMDASATFTEDTTFTAKYISGGADGAYGGLFDPQSKISITIDMSDAEWKKLDADYDNYKKSPIYRMADSVTITVENGGSSVEYYYEEVGVRMKGNTSRRKFYGDDGFYANVHYKLSFGETFDDEEEYKPDERKTWASKDVRKARKNRTLGGMKKIDIKYNKNCDESYVKDIYAMKLFRDNGIVAPQATLCGVKALNKNSSYINLGVYMLYEAVDETMVSRWVEDSSGDLYKCSWGSNVGADLTTARGTIGIENELHNEFYTYDKKTNKKAVDSNGDLDFSSMKDLISAINGRNVDFSQWIDVDYFAKFEAVNYILGNPDCMRNNSNNYYTYFLANGRAIFIPYDYDRCLGITKDWDPTNSAMMYMEPYTRKSAARGNQSNPIYIKLIDKGASTADGSALQKYRSNLIALSSSDALKPATFDAFKNSYKANYASVTSDAINTNNTQFDANDTGNVSYQQYITEKLRTLNNNIDNYR